MIENVVLGKMIKDYRTQKGYTQEQLAEAIHVTKQAVSNWELGKNRPDEITKELLTETLGIRFEPQNNKGGINLKIKQLENINDIEELRNTIEQIVSDIKYDAIYESTLRTLIEMTLWMVIGFERYKFHFAEDNNEEYEYDWGSIAWILDSLIDDKESYPFDDFRKMESFIKYSGYILKDKINYMAFSTGAELFEDFDEDGYRQDYPQLAARYTEQYGYKLCSLLPNIDSDILTIYKVALYNLSNYIYNIWDGEDDAYIEH